MWKLPLKYTVNNNDILTMNIYILILTLHQGKNLSSLYQIVNIIILFLYLYSSYTFQYCTYLYNYESNLNTTNK